MIPSTPSTSSGQGKIHIGWFSFSCCEDNTVIMTEVMNDHWQEWKKLFDFRHARVLQSHNVLDELDIAFIEGAVASETQAENKGVFLGAVHLLKHRDSRIRK